MKSITELAITNNRVTLAIISFFIIGGIVAFFEMPRAKDPTFMIRTAVINTQFPGATAERIETLVTKPLERKLRQIEEISFIESESKNGLSTIYVHIQDKYFDLDSIWSKIRTKLKHVRLPYGSSEATMSDSFSEVYGTIVTIVGEGYTYAELDKIANDVKEEFLNLKNVGQVKLIGQQKEKIYIEFSNAKLAEVGISPSELADIIKKRNIITPGGAITIGPQRLVLEPTGNLNTLAELGQTIVPLHGKNDILHLEDIVQIHRGYSEPRDPLVHSDSERSIALAISLNPGGNILDLGDSVKHMIEKLNAYYPIGIEFNLAFNEPNLVEYIINNFVLSLIEAIVIVMVVMLVTLGLRTGLIVTSLIPTSILAALFFMWKLDIGLNQVSLAALIISLGLLVDNAIVITESILVRMDEGASALDASIKTVDELKVSLLTASLTTAAAFLPIYMAESVAAEYTKALFEVVSITLLSSWILALTLTPMLSYIFLKVGSEPKFTYDNPMCNMFKKSLCSALRHRYLTMLFLGVLIAGSVFMNMSIPKIFFPPSSQPSLVVNIGLPEGTNIDKTEEITKELEFFLKTKQPNQVESYISFIGEGSPRFWINNTPMGRSSKTAEVLVNTVDIEANENIKEAIEEFTNKNFADALVVVNKLDNGPPVKNPLQLRISGPDIDKLQAYADDVKVILKSTSGVVNVSDDWGLWSEKIVVDINPSLAYHAGVSYSDIANSLQIALSGREITQFRSDDKTTPIIMRSSQNGQVDLDTLRSTLVFVPATGQSVPLTQVASIDLVWKPPMIINRDGVHTITINADVLDGTTVFDAKRVIDKHIDLLDWKNGYSYVYGGEIESSASAQEAIGAQLPFAFMIILMLLIIQFNSFRRTALILMTIPLGMIGVIFGLYITSSYFGFMTYLGVISLAGIVVNNAIILIERIEYEIDVNNLRPQDAIVEAAQRRMRPIMLTTMTTIVGLFPLWFSGGPLWEPMAISIIFGLGFATLLTLIVVPIFYSFMFRVGYDKNYKFIFDDTCAWKPKN